MAARAWIGTSGFTYEHWKGVFYPDGLPQRRWLEFYAEHFDTVELNNTFYRMPRAAVCEAWRDRTPEHFLFAVKANRVITHRFRLMDSRGWLGVFLEAAGHLGDKLGPILVQLPPLWHCDVPRLEEFLSRAPRRRWALEFRDSSWLCGPVYDVLRRHNAALCVHDLIADHPREVTADWVYLRYHGASGHDGNYSSSQLKSAAVTIERHLAAGRDVFAYFNNDVGGYAVRNATELKNRLGIPEPATRSR